MKIILHGQASDDTSRSLDDIINNIRKRYILDYINNMPCDVETKHRLVQSVVDRVREDAR